MRFADGSENDQRQAKLDRIYEQYGIEVIEDQLVNMLPDDFLEALEQVLAALPESFVQFTQIINVDPSQMDFEIRINAFDLREGEVQIGQGAVIPSMIYNRQFNHTFGRLPSKQENIARFKSIVVRAMAYSFIYHNPDLLAMWARIYTPGVISTRVFGLGQDQNMVVMPGMNDIVADMAFSIARYCSNAGQLNALCPDRHEFVKNEVMNGQSISGWNAPVLDDDEAPTGTEPGQGSVENPGERPPPDIPDGDYLPIFTEADVGTAAATLPDEHLSAHEQLISAIGELFQELPKFFSTCTEAIVYVPAVDTQKAFSMEGFVFVTQNSWYKPSFVDIDDDYEALKFRFKKILLNEMALRFLYFHPDVAEEWKEEFGEDMTDVEAYRGIREAVVAYWAYPDWLQGLNPARYNFIRTKVMDSFTF